MDLETEKILILRRQLAYRWTGNTFRGFWWIILFPEKGGGLKPFFGNLNHFYLFNHFQNYRNADITFSCSLNFKYEPVSPGKSSSNLRTRKKEATIFLKKLDGWSWSGSQVVHPIFIQTESYRLTARDCQTLIDHAHLFCLKEAGFCF